MPPKAATCSAAASVQPPANVASRRKTARSSAVEQVVGPVEGGPQRLVPRRGGARAALEDAERVVEPLRQLPDRQHPDPGRGQLDRQRQPVEPGANLGDGLLVGVGDGERRRHLPGPVLEQHGRVGPAKRRYRPGPLALDAEGLAAGREDAERGAVGEQALGQARAGGREVLAVVQHEQHRAAPGVAASAQVGRDGGDLVRFLGLGHAERRGHGRRDELRVGQRGELDPGDVGWLAGGSAGLGGRGHVRGGQPGRDGQRQPRLARAARAGQREHAALGEGTVHLAKLRLPAHQRRQPHRELSCGQHRHV